MKKYMVLSPTYEVIGMSWDPPEPAEYGRDYIVIEARNKREARIFAVRLWRAERKKTGERRYVTYYSDENPFARLTVLDTIGEFDGV